MNTRRPSPPPTINAVEHEQLEMDIELVGAPGKIDSVASLPHPFGVRFARPNRLRRFVELATPAFGVRCFGCK